MIVGMTVARPARLTPFSRLMMKLAPTTIAPVLPPLTNASPFPSLRSLKAAAIEQSDLAFKRETGSSCIVMTVGAWKISIPSRKMFRSAAALRSFPRRR